MTLSSDSLILVTGATGLVGSHVVARAQAEGLRVRALVRDQVRAESLRSRGVDVVEGELTDRNALARCAPGVTHVVHCAAKVGDWGPTEEYVAVNVGGLESLIEVVTKNGAIKRFVHISSLGVYPARDHYGSDESMPISAAGIDGYTRSKVEAEQLVRDRARNGRLPAIILRPGFIYGPGDRSVLPRLLERLRAGQFRYLGEKTQLMNNTFVDNLVDAIFLALNRDDLVGDVFNITDGRLVTKEEFVGTICDLAGIPRPQRGVRIRVAKAIAKVLETVWRWRGKTEAPILSQARIKFLGLNLDFCIDKAKRELAYNPRTDFQEAIAATMKAS
ncbi:3 beta-hydroxysteroid dehydrogenase/Delta 5--_4-isomerase [Caulifigura coniformis]|uniref:3 beta-hydroxysteroid dehydrogenase/Delta 5-->4-isomerase n=1 Tax=Caulifigura coniformis TaxID=2527983 RepID=A0A517S837_9PLAN|nr:NAD-dependent epimerase/dehydratase family protein [Caulifigura coniformis]QDT52263.1 3 beta-hydroxysteroid dehydrogenase/Delta 5-->4-isomerase [Caulifigura coniformis]